MFVLNHAEIFSITIIYLLHVLEKTTLNFRISRARKTDHSQTNKAVFPSLIVIIVMGYWDVEDGCIDEAKGRHQQLNKETRLNHIGCTYSMKWSSIYYQDSVITGFWSAVITGLIKMLVDPYADTSTSWYCEGRYRWIEEWCQQSEGGNDGKYHVAVTVGFLSFCVLLHPHIPKYALISPVESLSGNTAKSCTRLVYFLVKC